MRTTFAFNFVVSGTSTFIAVYIGTRNYFVALLVTIAVYTAINCVKAEAERVIEAIRTK